MVNDIDPAGWLVVYDVLTAWGCCCKDAISWRLVNGMESATGEIGTGEPWSKVARRQPGMGDALGALW